MVVDQLYHIIELTISIFNVMVIHQLFVYKNNISIVGSISMSRTSHSYKLYIMYNPSWLPR